MGTRVTITTSWRTKIIVNVKKVPHTQKSKIGAMYATLSHCLKVAAIPFTSDRTTSSTIRDNFLN